LVDSPGDVLRCELLAELARLENSGVVDQLVRWSQDETSDPAARAAAVHGLRTRGSRDPQVLRALEGLLATEHYALRRAAIETLAGFGEPRARTALQTYYPRSIDSREKRVIEAALRRRGTGG
jgi:HEAT repeat protein